MALKGWTKSLNSLSSTVSGYGTYLRGFQSASASASSRPLTTESTLSQNPPIEQRFQNSTASLIQSSIPEHIAAPTVTTTIYSFPDMTPLRFASYPSNLLHVPLRRDILHRAVIFEGDKTRQGTASTKWRDEIRGSGRKIRPQKGTGRARLGDKKSPMLRGGGVAFGPKPRDFSTDLPKKIYDLAWRMALSYRYRRGELLVVDEVTPPVDKRLMYLKKLFQVNGWGNAHGRSLIITDSNSDEWGQLLEQAGEEGRLLSRADVDVKDLLELGRLIVERTALEKILGSHQSDLVRPKSILPRPGGSIM